MKTCPLCRLGIKPKVAVVEFVGGLFDPDDPDFFIVDESILGVSHIHRDCLKETLMPHGKAAGE